MSANRRICATADHAILIAGELDRLEEWRQFCSGLGIRVLAEIHSDYAGQADRLPIAGGDGVLRGSIHHLERGDASLPMRPTVRALALDIAARFSSEPQP